MSRRPCLLILLIALLFIVFIDSITTDILSPNASPRPKQRHTDEWSIQGTLTNEFISLSGTRTDNNIMQFRAGGHILGFQPDKAYLVATDHALRVEFIGTPGVLPKAISDAQTANNILKKSTFSKVVYQDLWDGISLTYESREDGLTESIYIVAPGAEVSKIRLRYNVPVEVQEDGSLKLTFASGILTESAPIAWQEINSKLVPVEVSFRVLGDEVGFSVGQYDPSFPLTIDPTYQWHTFYGSSNVDCGFGIAVDGSGNIYVTGYSYAIWNGPAGELPLHAYSGNADIYILKLNSNGAYQWHTFYGSSGSFDNGAGIAVDGSGNVYVTGWSLATWNGPAGELPLHVYSGNTDIFLLKLNTNGAYQWHTFYGSSTNIENGFGIAVDRSGNPYVTGYSSATWNGPAGKLPLHAYSGGEDIFLLKLNTNGAYQWHTFYGSTNDDIGFGIAVDGGGNSYVAGGSPTTWNGPAGELPLHAYSGNADIFILKLNSNGAYQWHTFYGSSGNFDNGAGIAVDGSSNVYVTGWSYATWNGPAGELPLHAYSGSGDIFVLKLNTNGAYQWHTFYGSSTNIENGFGIAVDGSGNPYVTGYSYATWNGPAGELPLHAYSGGEDIFLLKLNTNGAYQWHTFYGSTNDDVGFGIAVDGSGNSYVTGGSPTTWNGPAGELPLHAYSGNFDIFILKLIGDSSFLPLTGILENPSEGQNVSGITTIHGWALDGKGITKVELYIDSQLVGNIPYGGTRKDVNSAYPSYPNSENCGFGILINYSVLSSGSHAVKVRLYNQDGQTLDLNASVNVKKFHGEFVTNVNPATWTLSNEAVTVGGTTRNYDIGIQWFNSTQGFEITDANQKTNDNDTAMAVYGTPTANSLPLVGTLENPSEGQNVSGITTIHGWGLDGKGITKVELYIDSQLIGNIPYGGTRKDVSGAYPNYPNSENCGFGILINYSVLSSGSHAVKVRLYNQDGQTIDFNASVNVKKFHGEFVTNVNPATWTLSNEAVTVGGTTRNYDIEIQWFNATQGFEIINVIQK